MFLSMFVILLYQTLIYREIDYMDSYLNLMERVVEGVKVDLFYSFNIMQIKVMRYKMNTFLIAINYKSFKGFIFIYDIHGKHVGK